MGKGLPPWPAFATSAAVTMELGDKSGPRPAAGNGKLAFWRKCLVRPKRSGPLTQRTSSTTSRALMAGKFFQGTNEITSLP